MRTFLFLAIPLAMLLVGGEISQSITGDNSDWGAVPGVAVAGGIILIAFFLRHNLAMLLGMVFITALIAVSSGALAAVVVTAGLWAAPILLVVLGAFGILIMLSALF